MGLIFPIQFFGSFEVTETESKKTATKWIGATIIIIGIIIVASIFLTRNFSTPQAESEPETNKLSIASFTSEVSADEPEIQAYLDLEIDDYWVEENQVKCKGTIKWHTTEYTLEGMSVTMTIKESQTNSVNVNVMVYGGFLLLATGTIDSDSVEIPKLGEDLFTFNFSIACTYS